jgi:hypothetical protein
VIILAATVLSIGVLAESAEPGRSSSGADDRGAGHQRDIWQRPPMASLGPGPRSRAPPATTRASLAGRYGTDDPRVYLLQAAAQAHRSGSLGLLSTVGCADCPTLGVRGMSDARLDHAQ